MASADDLLNAFRRNGRIVIVGASMAGLRAAETLRAEGFTGSLTLIGDEPHEPYDRVPLSKQVLMGQLPPDGTALPRRRALDAEWRLGAAATGLDLDSRRVLLADGDEVEYDRLLITTGVHSRPWPQESEASLDGVFVLRTRDHAEELNRHLAAGPRRVLVIGGGFTGCEIASSCRSRGLAVTLTERGPAPLVGALGAVAGGVAAELQTAHGVDLRCGTTVTELEGDSAGRLKRAHLSDGTTVDAEVAVVALGAVRNTQWLADSGLAVSPRGVACDAGCRVFDLHGIVVDDVFAAGDVARCPHPLFEYQYLSLEHWGNAVAQAEVAAHNMISSRRGRRPHLWTPAFWSYQFGVNIKSVGVPSMGDEIVVTQGSLAERRFVAVYGHGGRIIAAVSFDGGRWLGFYQELIESAAAFPPAFATVDRRAEEMQPVPAGFPDRALPDHGPSVVLTGHFPSERRITRRGAPG